VSTLQRSRRLPRKTCGLEMAVPTAAESGRKSSQGCAEQRREKKEEATNWEHPPFRGKRSPDFVFRLSYVVCLEIRG
jgi:hypothetical protein